MRNPWFGIGSLLVAIGIGAGALGAHSLRSTLESRSLELWTTAARYLDLSGLGLLAIGLAADRRPRRGWGIAGTLVLVGSLLFSGTVGALALAAPRWLGAVTPIGGVLLIAGYVILGLAALR